MNSKNKIVKMDNKSKHLKFFAVTVAIIIFLLILRLFWLQFVQGSELKEMAYKQITSSTVISPKRGTIYDSTGKTLAVSVQVDTISVNPSLISVKNDSEKTNALKEKVAQGLSESLELDYNEVLVKLTSVNSVEVIAKKVETDKVEKLKKWMSDNDIYSGINIDEDTKRYYPYYNLASNLLGFCGNDNNGLAGLEYYWDDTLTGTPGRIITSIDATQSSIPDDNEKYVAPENGSNITLSINANIQTIVEKYLKQAVQENNCKNGGSMILMNPNTGDILAMATYPDYNLNTPFTPNEKLSETWDSLSSEEKTNSLYEMYRNKVVSSTYEPGSVFKIITASAGLEEDLVETDTSGDFYCSGVEDVYGVKIKCAKSSGHGSQSLRNALENSCNPALIQLGQRIGATTLYKYIEAFGFFDKTGIATSGESSSNFHKLEDVGPVELATICFGQRFEITPLQMITAACAIANGGTLVQPRIVTKIENSDTNVTTNIEVKKVRQVISSETAAKMRNMMQSVVTDGGGQSGAVAGYSIGGKTGTSEPNANREDEGFTASFLAIAPVENTQVVRLYTQNNDTSVSTTVPDLKGKSLSSAKSALKSKNLNIQVTGSGTVVSQDISAGTSVEEGTVIKVTLQEVTSDLH